MATTLRKVGMCRPAAILSVDHRRWHYTKPLDAAQLVAQYETFVSHVQASGAEIVWMPDGVSETASESAIDSAIDIGPDGLADSIFTYDPSFVVPAGAIVLRPGKDLRAGEADVHRSFYEAHAIPIIGTIETPGTVEGGDIFWLDSNTLAVGRGFRTNRSGIEQLGDILRPHHIELAVYDLPYYRGPEACLHLMSLVSALDDDLALVHAPLMPTALYERMRDMGYTLLEAPVDEFEASLGLNLNVLATAPREVIAVDGFHHTAALMRDAGCAVTTFRADELCLPCEGGPTCLTRPILRG